MPTMINLKLKANRTDPLAYMAAADQLDEAGEDGSAVRKPDSGYQGLPCFHSRQRHEARRRADWRHAGPAIRPASRPHRGRPMTHCQRGHVLDASNRYLGSDGHTRCLECRRAADRERWRRLAMQPGYAAMRKVLRAKYRRRTK